MPLNIDFQQIFLHLFNFIILATGLYLLLYRPVVAFMDQRKAHYEEIERQAAEKDAAAQQKLDAYDARLKAADEEIQRRADDANRQLEARKQERLQRAQEQADKLIEEARRAAERERAAMLEGAKQDIADMVVSAAGKLADKEIDPAADRALYDRFLEEAQAAQEDRP